MRKCTPVHIIPGIIFTASEKNTHEARHHTVKPSVILSHVARNMTIRDLCKLPVGASSRFSFVSFFVTDLGGTKFTAVSLFSF